VHAFILPTDLALNGEVVDLMKSSSFAFFGLEVYS